MNLSWIIGGVLALAFVPGIVQAVRGVHAHRVARLALQVVAAVLLYACLLPPSTREVFDAHELVVLTPGAAPAQLASLHASASVIALPGSIDQSGLESAPDLATALRRHPDSRRLRIVGGGLSPRDRDAARGLVIGFDAAPLPRGVVELDTSPALRAGSQWWLRGRVEGAAGGRVELRDPSDAVVASGSLGDAGDFLLRAQAKSTGGALFTLRVFDHEGARVEDVDVPVAARNGERLKVLLLAGAPDPELKYLRRWAADAEVAIDSRVAMSEGIAMTEGDAKFDSAALANTDIAIVDERSWAALGAADKNALIAAEREGMGLLLRVTGPVAAPVAAEWAAFGFTLRSSDAAQTVSLTQALGLGDNAATFTRRALAVDAQDAAPLLRTDDGSPVALWRTQGQGRIGIWWLGDSWKLALGGDRAQFATLWSDTLATLARACAVQAPDLPQRSRVDERATICGVTNGDAVEDAAGARVALVVEQRDGARGCAAYWPAQPGWYVLVSGDSRWPFHAYAQDTALALECADRLRATQAMLGASAASAQTATRPHPLPRWPFFLAWLVAIAALWWLERTATSASPQAI